MIRIKLGVVIAGLDPLGDMLEPAYVAAKLWEEQGWGDFWITGGIDGNHSAAPLSGHYKGSSSDGRLPPDPARAVTLLSERLPKWKVMLEIDKNHIHFQRK